MWDRFYGDRDVQSKGRELFLDRLEQLGLIDTADDGLREGATRRHTSTAAIQGLFITNKDDMAGAVEMAEGLIPRIYEPELEQPGALKIPA
jgi:chaperone BCS1